MKNKNEHVVVKKYLEEHSLVESNIISFNDFVENRMQEIINEVNATIPQEDFEVHFGKIKVGKPQIIESDGSTSLIMPYEARIRNLTYSAPIFLEITIKKEGQIDSGTVEIGRMPIMIKSSVCNTCNLQSEDLIKNYDDPLDTGGYFIINGNERVMIMSEDLAENQPFIEKNSKKQLLLRMFSSRGIYRIPTVVSENKDGILEVSFSRFRNIPAIIVLKALGMVKEADMAKYIGKETDSLIVNLYEFVNLSDSEEAMMKIAEDSAVQGTKKEILDRIKQRIDSYLLPNIGQKKEDRIKKAITLCKLIKQFLIAKENPNLKTDKDHYSNKRIRLSGDLMANLFRVNLGILVRDIQYSLQKSVKRRKLFSIKTIAKSTLFSHRIESAIATGSWTGDRSGVTQNMDKTNYLSTISQLQRVSSMLPSDQENLMARTLHPTHYGKLCPIETPEGTEIGLRKNLAILCKISTRINWDENVFVKDLEADGLNRNGEEGTDVFLDGKFLGVVSNANEFAKRIKEKRRNQQIPMEVSIRNNLNFNNIMISTEPGRAMRPLIILDNGVPRLTQEHLIKLQQNEMKWNDLLKEKIIEYLDTSEEEDALIALYEKDLTEEHTHLEVDSMDLLGIISSITPYINHNSNSKLVKGTKSYKQSLGIYAANYLCRLDTDVSVLAYPQKPIVRSFVYDTLNMYPAGQNLIVAIMPQSGYNMQDALVINKGSLDRGMGRSFYFRPYSAVEINYAGGLKDEILIPEKGTSGYRTGESYRFLDDDGIISPEAEINEGEVLIGKISPPKFLSEAREISVKTQKESSVTMRQEENGVIDAVFVTKDSEGNKIVQVRTRDLRIPEIGDKYSTPYGQKGVIGLIVPEEDVPFTSKGIKPDIMFNPHGLPSRMTIGYLLEMLAGKVGCLRGEVIDGTPFSGEEKDSLEDSLQEFGFRYDGKESVYNPINGKLMKAKIFIGNLYYLKLKYMVANKIHARASGKIALLTRQPIEGRSRGGALRLGEMEQQALVAHGASLLLKERYDSDKTLLYICKNCGSIAVEDIIRNKISCPLCDSEDAEPVEVSYVFKLLLEELQGLHIRTKMKLKNKYE